MLKRLRAWLDKNRKWNEEHRRTWEGVTDPGPDGLSPFQRDTEALVRAALRERGLELAGRELVRTEGDAENYIVADIPRLAAKIWIYRDQTDVVTPTSELRLEEWDARTPDEHRARVIDFIRCLQASEDAG